MIVLGLDASRGKWLLVALEDGSFAAADLVGSAAAAISAWPEATAVGIDIPIGLPETPGRDADRAARDFVGERRSSVFATFPAAVQEASNYEDAKKLCVENGWPRPSLQSFGMRHRIIEIRQLAQEDERVFEVHPEVSFRALVGEPLPSKRSSRGVSMRRVALAGAGIELPDDVPYPEDDVLDAAVAAWTAVRYASGRAESFPPEHVGRVGAIWR